MDEEIKPIHHVMMAFVVAAILFVEPLVEWVLG
jgi:hypothetical protein